VEVLRVRCCWILVAGVLFSASPVSSADYARIATPTHVYELFAGKPKVTPQPPTVPRIFRLISASSTHENPLQLAELIAYHSKRPLLMAAMACQESRFQEGAVSRCGALGMWQLMDEWQGPGYSPFNNLDNLRRAERVLAVKVQEAGGDLWLGVERYNGAGPAARAYRSAVRETWEELRRGEKV